VLQNATAAGHEAEHHGWRNAVAAGHEDEHDGRQRPHARLWRQSSIHHVPPHAQLWWHSATHQAAGHLQLVCLVSTCTRGTTDRAILRWLSTTTFVAVVVVRLATSTTLVLSNSTILGILVILDWDPAPEAAAVLVAASCTTFRVPAGTGGPAGSWRHSHVASSSSWGCR
jgi:hypothetical protein